MAGYCGRSSINGRSGTIGIIGEMEDSNEYFGY